MPVKIPRMEFTELPDSIAELLRSKYERLGYLGEFFARTAHQEEALRSFIEFTEASKGALDMRLVEAIALTVAVMGEVAYERNQHERLSVKLGFGAQWVKAVEALAPDHSSLSPEERCVQKYVMHAVEHNGRGSSALLDELVDAVGHEKAVAVMMVMARYIGHAVLVNSMDIEAPVSSIFDDQAGFLERSQHE